MCYNDLGWGELFSQQAQGLVEQTHAIAGGAGLPAGELALQEGGAGDVQMGKVPSLGKLPDQQSGRNGTAALAAGDGSRQWWRSSSAPGTVHRPASATPSRRRLPRPSGSSR